MHFNYQRSIIILVRKICSFHTNRGGCQGYDSRHTPPHRGTKMIETFYGQIKEFGVLISQNKEHEINTYIYGDSQIDVYLKQGKPITIIVSK